MARLYELFPIPPNSPRDRKAKVGWLNSHNSSSEGTIENAKSKALKINILNSTFVIQYSFPPPSTFLCIFPSVIYLCALFSSKINNNVRQSRNELLKKKSEKVKKGRAIRIPYSPSTPFPPSTPSLLATTK